MLYNKDFLLLHCPKTAGKSVAAWFCRNFESPIHGIVSQGQFNEIGIGAKEGVYLEQGTAHQGFTEARSILDTRSIDISQFRALILTIRNPYDLVVSKYFFMRKAYETDITVKDRPYFQAAGTGSFESFCATVPLGDITRFMPPEDCSGKPPVELICFESLGPSLSALAQKYGVAETYTLPHLNKTERPRKLAKFYDAQSKGHVDEKMDDWFRLGGYKKIL